MLGAQPPVTPGTVIAGKYRVERTLGTGGMGVVVAALHEALDERVAIKLLRADRVMNGEAVERALREARTAVKIQSEHVARVFDVGMLDSGAPYIVMEYLAGCDLAQLLTAEGKLDIADAITYVREACDAVIKAHALGVIHRDLKPANLFLAVRDDIATIKVLDFGISKLAATEDKPSLTQTAAVMGSPAYMSPEQLETPRDVDGRTDVWSLGVILYELLTGAHPFVADSLPQLYRKIAEQEAPRVRALREDSPEELDAIVARCLAKAREDRFPDVASLTAALAPLTRPGRRSAAAMAETALSLQPAAERGGDSLPVRSNPSVPQQLANAPRTLVPRPRRWIAYAGLGAAAAAAVTVTAMMKKADSTPPAAAAVAAPAAKPADLLACPPLVASGVEEPAGWLGAATSSIACARAQAYMGGRSARTLTPAELVGLPRTAVDGFPDDAFATAAARTRAIDAAKAKNAVWLDGHVERDPDGFAVTLQLRRGTAEVVHGEGKGVTLVAAIRGAMQPLLGSGALARGADHDPFLAEWVGATTPEGAVAVVDWGIGTRIEWPDLSDECGQLVARKDITPLLRDVAMLWCELPGARKDALPLDRSSPGALRLSIEADPKRATPLPEVLVALDTAIAAAKGREERSLLYAEKASVLSAANEPDRATDAALAAIALDPKVLDVLSPAWAVISWLRAASNAAPATVAWYPWSPEAYCFSATQSDDNTKRIAWLRRNHAMSHSAVWSETLAEYLIAGGFRDEARTLATQVPGDGLRVIANLSELKLDNARQILVSGMSRDAKAASIDRFDVAYLASYGWMVRELTGKPVDGIAALLPRLYPEGVKANGLADYLTMMGCMGATQNVARTCLARLRKVTGGRIGFIDGLLDGAERYNERDYAGAARAWKPMLARPGWQLDGIRDLMASAFEKTGEDELLSRTDAPLLALPGRFNGADLAHVRAARRLARAGKLDQAKKYAQRVIDAWSVASGEMPAVAEMRKLVARP